jgi:hypothetical protein
MGNTREKPEHEASCASSQVAHPGKLDSTLLQQCQLTPGPVLWKPQNKNALAEEEMQ